jgi:hypothetical protein
MGQRVTQHAQLSAPELACGRRGVTYVAVEMSVVGAEEKV